MVASNPPSGNRKSQVGRVAALAILVLALTLVPLVQAHAQLMESTPPAGARLAEAPAEVSVTLTEPIESGSARIYVYNESNVRVDQDNLHAAGTEQPQLTISLLANLGDGSYRIVWSAISQDSHSIGGTIGFAVGNHEPPASTSPTALGAPPSAVFGRALVYLGLALAFGGAVFLYAIGSPNRAAGEVGKLALFAGANVHLGGVALLAHAYVQASPFTWLEATTTAVGKVLLLRLILALGALALLLLNRTRQLHHPAQPAFAFGLMATAGVGSALLGHPVVHGVSAIIVDFIHMFAALVWAGGLLVFLWFMIRARPTVDAGELLQIGVRFGTVALMSVLALFLAGVGSSIALVGPALFTSPSGVLQTPWAGFLAAKVGLGLVMVAVAGFNRYVFLAPPSTRGLAGTLQRAAGRLHPSLRPLLSGASPRTVRHGIALESFIGVVIIGLAAILASIAPPNLG